MDYFMMDYKGFRDYSKLAPFLGGEPVGPFVIYNINKLWLEYYEYLITWILCNSRCSINYILGDRPQVMFACVKDSYFNFDAFICKS